MKININHKILYLFLSSFVLLSIFFLIRTYCVGNFVQVDDVGSTNPYFFHNVLYSPYGNIFVTFFDNFFGGYIPLKLGLHPSYYKSVYFSYIEACIFTSLIFVHSLILYRKIDKLFPFAIITAFSIFLYCASWQLYFIFFVYDTISRFVLAALYWSLLYLFLVLDNDNNKKSYILPISILTFLCSTSNELFCITTLIGLLLYYFVQEKNKKNNLIIIYFIIAFAGFLFLILSGMYTRKTDFDTLNIAYFINILKSIPEYTLLYIKCLFMDHFFEYLLIAAQIFILCKKGILNSNHKNTIKLSLCFIFGYLIFMYLLILLGKSRHDADVYWIIHPELHFCISIINYACNMALFNIIMSLNIIKKQVIYIIFVLFPLIFCFLLKDIYINKKIFLKEQYINTYKAEKIIRIANAKNKTAVLDEDLLEIDLNWHLFNNYPNQKPNKIYDTIKYINFLNQFEKDNQINCKVIFKNKEIVEKEFKNNGGSFSEEELMNPNFNNLLNKDFLYNKI